MPQLLAASQYWDRLTEFRQHYSDSLILVQYFEDFVDSPRSVVERCCEFLGIDKDGDVAPSTLENTRKHKSVDRGLLKWLRGKTWYTPANWLLPRGLVRRVRPWLRRKIDVDVSWDVDRKRELTDQLRDQSRKLFEFTGKPRDFWHVGV